MKEAFDVVKIDELALDKECINLPTQYLRAAFTAANTRNEVAALSDKHDRLEAALMNKVRNNPDDYDLDKVTEAGIRAAVQTLAEYNESLKVLREVKYQLEMQTALVAALDYKKRSLSLLVDLHMKSYHADVRVSAEQREAVNQQTQEAVRTKTRMPNPRS